MSDVDGLGTPRVLLVGAVFLGLLVTTLVMLAVRLTSGDTPALTLSSKAARAATPPRPLSPDETYVRTEVLPSGDLEVTQWIQSSVLLFTVQLTVPSATGTGTVGVEDVHVTVDGEETTTPPLVDGPSRTYTFLGTRSVQVRYRLTGAVETSTSAPGRGLVRVSSLDVTYEPPSARVTRSVLAAEVLSLACSPPVPGAASTPCGTQDDATAWTVDLTGERADDLVLAQVTLE
ncbi:hypothetical protein [Nocardioides sp. Soil805]|uniref:hypothetical protein n=1 Tax=Nocardioides sp. Soil805 TaxID=1736416 RepID=UPI0007025E8E|nr:hypothetical protein [Nocardioides sp. Soil805]KRF36273.1 hypothetical protein ASG94_02025 [Nocardioides sp. Soil805]